MIINISQKDLELVLQALQCAMENAEEVMDDDCDEDVADGLTSTCAEAERVFDDLTKQAEKNVESINVVIKVDEDQVRAVWSDGPVSVEVYDLYLSSCASLKEKKEQEEKDAYLDKISEDPAYKVVW